MENRTQSIENELIENRTQSTENELMENRTQLMENQSIENELTENRTQKFCSIPLLFFQRFDHGAAQKIEHKMSHLNIAFDRYASIGTIMHYILVIS